MRELLGSVLLCSLIYALTTLLESVIRNTFAISYSVALVIAFFLSLFGLGFFSLTAGVIYANFRNKKK